MSTILFMILSTFCGSAWANESCLRQEAPLSTSAVKDFSDMNLASIKLASFCDSPYKFVCGDALGTKDARDSSFFEATKAARKKGWNAVASALGEADDTIWPLSAYSAAIYNKYFNEAIASRLRPLEIETVTKTAQKVKIFLLSAIDEQVRRRALDASQAASMKTRIEDTAVYASFNVELFASLPAPLVGQLAHNYWSVCGSDGTDSNAFYTKIVDRSYVIMCPGLLLRATGQGTDSQSNFYNLAFVLGHELGHRIDSTYEPFFSYAPFASCLMAEHKARLSNPDKFGKYLSEITADFWGEKTVVQYLKTLPAEERLTAVSEIFAPICGTVDDGEHPSDRWRIEVILRRDPDFARLMGCPAGNFRQKPGCSLEGYAPSAAN